MKDRKKLPELQKKNGEKVQPIQIVREDIKMFLRHRKKGPNSLIIKRQQNNTEIVFLNHQVNENEKV